MKPLYAILILMVALVAWAQEDTNSTVGPYEADSIAPNWTNRTDVLCEQELPPWSPTAEQAESMGYFKKAEPIAPSSESMPKLSSEILSGPLMPPPPTLFEESTFHYTVVTGYIYNVAYETNSADGVVRQIDSVTITNKVNVPVYPKFLEIQPTVAGTVDGEYIPFGAPIVVKIDFVTNGFYSARLSIK